MIKGWECPKCGRVWSPYTTSCKHCNDKIAALAADEAAGPKGRK